MEKSRKITLLATIVLVGFVWAVVFHYFLGFYFHVPYPFNTFLSMPKDFFGDFLFTLPDVKRFVPYSQIDGWMVYFPLAYILLIPFAYIKNKILASFIFAFGFVFFLIFMNIKFLYAKNLMKVENFRNIFIMTFLSYPFLYMIDRGNLDMYLFMVFVGFVYLFKSKKYLLSAVLIGLANAMKPFSALFLILFLFKKRYKEFFLSLFLTLILVIGGFLFFKGGFFNQVHIYHANLVMFKKLWIYDKERGLLQCSSLFSALKFLLCSYKQIISSSLLEKIYSYLGFIITSIIIFFAYREKTYWKTVTLLTLHMLLVPYIICDYKLIFLFVPIWLFANAEEKTRFDKVYTILFGLLLIPKKIFMLWIHIGTVSQLVTYGVIINPILMILFIGLIIYEQFSKKGAEKMLK